MGLSPAYAVDGGTVPAAMLRMLAWCGTNGNTGVVQPNDLKVYQLATPGPAVNVRAGGALLVNPAVQAESYAIKNDATVQVPIPASQSDGAKTWYVIARIDDPIFTGSTPANPVTALYCSLTLVASSVSNLAYPAIPLAKVVVPANTATITNSMITDLRSVANVQTKLATIIRPAVATDTGLSLGAVGGTGEVFPNIGDVHIDVPPWATRMQIIYNLSSVIYPSGVNAYGYYWIEYGPFNPNGTWKYKTQEWAFDSTGTPGNQRTNWRLADDRYVPADIRGTTITVGHKARYKDTKSDHGVKIDALSGVDTQIWWLGEADSSFEFID